MKPVASLHVAALLAGGLLLAGCSGDAAPSASTNASTSPDASTSASSPASPSPTSTLTAEEQQAFDEATKVVLSYRQTITDLYSGARTNLNDLNEVATGDKVDQDLIAIQQSLGDGWRSEPEGAALILVSSEPISVDLGSDPNTVTIRACVDGTAVTGVAPSGQRTPGGREQADYTVTRTTYLPAPGWAVTRTKVATDPEDRRC